MQLAQSCRTVEPAKASDVPEIARLLVQLYRAEAPEMVPDDEASFRMLLEEGLRVQGRDLGESSLVIRDIAGEATTLAGYVALSCDHNPRKPPFNGKYLAAAFRWLGPAAATVLRRQFRLMGLMCAPLPPRTAQLHSLVIDSRHRGESLGAALVRGVEDQAFRRDQRAIILFIVGGNPVEDFYSQLGYRRVPLPRPKLPFPHPGIAMQRPL